MVPDLHTCHRCEWVASPAMADVAGRATRSGIALPATRAQMSHLCSIVEFWCLTAIVPGCQHHLHKAFGSENDARECPDYQSQLKWVGW